MWNVQLTLQPAKIYGVQIGPSRRIERLFNVLYLDEKVRVVEFLPNESPDSNSTVPVLFVMRRLSKVPRHQADTQVSFYFSSSGNRRSDFLHLMLPGS